MFDIATKKFKLSEIEFPFSVDEAVEDLVKSPSAPYRKKEEIPFIRKYIVQEKAETKGLEYGQVRHWISTTTLDSYGEMMMPKGAELKYYKKNPMVLWCHNYREPENVMGSNIDLEVYDRGIVALTQFAMTEEKAAQVYRLYKGEHLRMWSVGFIPIKGRKPDEKERDKFSIIIGPPPDPTKLNYIHEKWRLLEYSAVPVGACPDAITIAVAKSLDLSDDLIKDLEIKAEEVVDKATHEPGKKAIIDLGGKSQDDPQEKERKEKKETEKETEGEEEKLEEVLSQLELSAEEYEALEWDSAEGVDPETFRKEYEGGTPVEVDEEMKPYPNEHACRLKDPSLFQKGSFRSYERDSGGKKYRVIAGRLKGKTTMTEQAFRYPKDVWSVSQARKHCKDHKGIAFEPAAGKVLEGHDEKAALGTLPEEVIVWIKGQIEQIRDVVESGVKSGRELSAKNIKILKDTASELAEASEKLAAASTRIKELVESVEGKEGKSGETVMKLAEKKEQEEGGKRTVIKLHTEAQLTPEAIAKGIKTEDVANLIIKRLRTIADKKA